MTPQQMYDEAINKLRWNMQRKKEERADKWALLATLIAELYKVKEFEDTECPK